MNIFLPEMKAWIERQAEGVRDAAQESGPTEPFDLDAYLSRFQDGIASRLKSSDRGKTA